MDKFYLFQSILLCLKLFQDGKFLTLYLENLGKNYLSEISKIWKNLDEAEKKIYYQQSNAEKELYAWSAKIFLSSRKSWKKLLNSKKFMILFL